MAYVTVRFLDSEHGLTEQEVSHRRSERSAVYQKRFQGVLLINAVLGSDAAGLM